MPLYDIHHSLGLTPKSRQHLAEKLTALHCSTFTTPSLFVNVRFSPCNVEEDYFYNGKRRSNTNRIIIHVRSGAARTNDIFEGLMEKVEKIWDEVVAISPEKAEEAGMDKKELEGRKLHAVFVVPGILAREAGFTVPGAGEEAEWYEKNTDVFKKRAAAGEEDMKLLLDELERRPELTNKEKSS